MNINPVPTNLKHPFWKATNGSSLKLSLEDSDQNQSLVITVHSVNEPYVYKLVQDDPNQPLKLYMNKKEAIKYIKTQWWDCYGDKTMVEYTEQKEAVPSLYVESCPPTPSPRSIRKNSLKTLLGSPRNTGVPNLCLSENSSQSSSRSNSRSNSPSPRELLCSKSIEPISSSEPSSPNLTSKKSPRGLLRSVSLQLQTDLFRKNTDHLSSPGTPPNSFNLESSPSISADN